MSPLVEQLHEDRTRSVVHAITTCAPHSSTIACVPTALLIGILQVFDTLDKDGSGYVDEREWRRLTEDTPLAASDDTFLFVQRVCYSITTEYRVFLLSWCMMHLPSPLVGY